MPVSASDISNFFSDAAAVAARLTTASDAEVIQALGCLAALRAGRQIQVIGPELVTLEVDYGQSLRDLVAAGPASQYASANLTDEHFPHPERVSGKDEVTFEIVGPFGRVVSDSEVTAARQNAELAPTDAWQIITLGRARPDLIVVGDLAAGWVSPYGYRVVPVSIKGLADLDWVGYGWHEHCVFPGVRASKRLVSRDLGASGAWNLGTLPFFKTAFALTGRRIASASCGGETALWYNLTWM